MKVTNSTVPVYTGTVTTTAGGCTCGPNEACSECPKPSVSADDVRQALLRSMLTHASIPGTHANDVRNWASAYGILTDKVLIERDIQRRSTDAEAQAEAARNLGR